MHGGGFGYDARRIDAIPLSRAARVRGALFSAAGKFWHRYSCFVWRMSGAGDFLQS